MHASLTRSSRTVPLAFAVACFAALGGAAEALAQPPPTVQQCNLALESVLAKRKAGALLEARKQAVVCAQESCGCKQDSCKKIRAECDAKMSELATAIPSVVFIGKAGTSDIADVSVTLDGKPLGPQLDGKAIELDPGTHHVTASHAPHADLEKDLVVVEGEQRRQIVLEFGAAAPRPTPPVARVSVPSMPEAASDSAPSGGAPRGSTSTTAPGSKPGATAAPEVVPAEATSEAGRPSPVAIAGFSVAGAALLVGVITGGVSLAQTSTLADECPDKRCSADLQGDIDRAKALGHASTAAFAIAGAGAVLGVVGLFMPAGSDDSNKSSGAIEPVVGLGSLGVRAGF